MGSTARTLCTLNRFHVDLNRSGTTYKSLVDMEQEEHTGRPATVRFF